jgi:hypothetical protein
VSEERRRQQRQRQQQHRERESRGWRGRRTRTACGREDVPKAKSLVAGARHDRLPIGRHGEVQHACGMTLVQWRHQRGQRRRLGKGTRHTSEEAKAYGERGDLSHRRIAPHRDLVLRIAVRRYLCVHDACRPSARTPRCARVAVGQCEERRTWRVVPTR